MGNSPNEKSNTYEKEETPDMLDARRRWEASNAHIATQADDSNLTVSDDWWLLNNTQWGLDEEQNLDDLIDTDLYRQPKKGVLKQS
jgi:hypothetical protein